MYLVWQQRLFTHLAIPQGHNIEIIHPGLRNYDAGPDFFNAKVRIDGQLWAGNVEMHNRASDWHRHHHDHNTAYDTVILHVVLQADTEIHLPDGTPLQTVVMTIPNTILQGYKQLCSGQRHAPLLPGQVPHYTSISCSPHLEQIPKLIINDWINALYCQRLTDKAERVRHLVTDDLKDWHDAFFVILTRSLGTGINSDAMERLARSIPYASLLHHRDNLLQIQAILLGQAGFLQAQDATDKPSAQQAEWRLMQREYAFLRQKFQLTPLPVSIWKVGRIRPYALPEVRLRALAQLISTHTDLFAEMLDAPDAQHLVQFFRTKGLGLQTIHSLIINAALPILFFYARWQGDMDRTEKVLSFIEQIPPENNRYIRQWQQAGLPLTNALHTQGLLHLFQHYCQPHKCTRCRIGCYILARIYPHSSTIPKKE